MASRPLIRARTRAPEGTAEGGFTLVEVIVAIALFAVLASLAAGFMVSALRTSKVNADRIVAANIARSHLEQLRAEGTGSFTPGLTVIPADDGVAPDAGNGVFTIRTTANWATINQTTTTCVGAAVTPNYLRVHIEVTSPSLTTPEVVDGLIQPDIAPANSASLLVSVADQGNVPVSDAQVTLTDTTNGSNNKTFTTGVDGCLLIRGLTAPAALVVTVYRPGFVPSSSGGNVQAVSLSATVPPDPVAFKYAAAASISFLGSGGTYPVPAVFPFSWKLQSTESATTITGQGQSVTGLWPLTTGFTAWLGTCSDADPQEQDVSRTIYGLAAGATTPVMAVAAPVLITGLDPGTEVTAAYAGPDATCTPRSVSIGATDATGQLRVALPFGLWRFTGDDETQTLSSPLKPNADGTPKAAEPVTFSISDRTAARTSATSKAADAQQAAIADGVRTDYTGAREVVRKWTCTAAPLHPFTPGSPVSQEIGGGFTITCAKAL